MDRPERPAGLPLGAATQSTGRGLPENPAQGRRAVAAAGSGPMVPPPPPLPASVSNNLRNQSSNPTLSTLAPIAASQVIALAREAMRDALRDNDQQAGDTTGVNSDMQPGLTIDLSRKNIQKLPDEVVDIIKDKIERLALSHNKLASFPTRFAECLSLRYLNVRSNDMRNFPLPLCDLRSLEILDLGRNKIQILPPDIVKLTSLKVFALQKNRIQELPLCLAEMSSLQMLKLEGNPIKFPPPEVFQVQAGSPSNEGILKESEVTEVTVTSHIKKYLKQRASNGRVDTDTGGDESSEGMETPRLPVKRVVSGRFPIKVNGTDVGELRSPALSRPPPIPTRSHYRGLSQQNAAVRRPGVMPLTIGNVNERVRSNSETLLAARAERPGDRARRMGAMSKRAQELGTLDETEANNRFSHYRGLSHGSAMTGNGGTLVTKSPASPATDQYINRPVYVRRMSILPERRRESKFYDPVIEAAKGILYSVFQIHPMIQTLMGLTNDGTAKRSSLEIVFYNTISHVEELEREIQRHDPLSEGGEDFGRGENESVHRACVTLVNAYAHVCTLLANNIDQFIDNGDPRYIRTLLVQLYNSIMELRVTASQASGEESYSRAITRAGLGDTIKPHSRDNSVTPTVERLGPTQRNVRGNFQHNPSNLRVATDVTMPYINGTGRTATITSATPRSGESFASGSSRGITGDFTDDDRMFEKIFLSLSRTTDLMMRTLPSFNNQCAVGARNASNQRAPDSVLQIWKALNSDCIMAIQQTEMLKSRLSNIKLKEPGVRTQGAFWTLCSNFMDSWSDFGNSVKRSINQIPLPPDTRARLRPIHQSMKDTMDLILQSPWAYYIKQNNLASRAMSPFGSNTNSVQLPMTPQSAALGPAVQATVPSTPQSASFAKAFSGNVFERADTLISNGGLSISSRNGTFTSGSSASMSSINSTLSSTMGDTMTPPSMMLSPGASFGPMPMKLGGSRVAY